jgi:asparagine synthase (glutamine-hydrolysing)
MSGIAGIYNLDGKPVNQTLLGRMIDCISHRGPDGARVWTDGFIGLGHRQLCTTEESLHEIQPSNNRSGTCWITFDGRVDNRKELIERLRPKIGELKAPTDVELMLYAYEVWGTECLKWIIGDFAFALWDAKKRHLFCGRDTYGIRPFYYHFDGKTFTFGSEVHQIFQNPRIPLEINEDRIVESFTYGGMFHLTYRDINQTYFRGISELPFAHYLVVNKSGLRLHRYWDVDPKYEIRYRKSEEYTEHFYHLFREIIRTQLRSCGPIGAELSGGLDSSSIVCMAQEIYRSGEIKKQRFATFSNVFDELPCDERQQIEYIVRKYELESHYVVSDHLCGLRNLPPGTDPVLELDGPNEFHLQKPVEELYKLAHKQGIRVMLSGEGPEIHLFGGEYVFDSLIRHFNLRELCYRLWVISTLRPFPRGLMDGLRKFIRLGLIPVLPESISVPAYYKWFYPWTYEPHFPDWLTPPFRSKVLEKTLEQKERLMKLRRFREWGRQAEYEALNPSNPLLRIPLPLPMERRFPYFDRRLIEFALAIPPEQKYKHINGVRTGYGRSRVLQRGALEGILPEEIRCSRVKLAFNPVSVRRFTQFKDAYRKMFSPPSIPLVAQLGYVEHEKFWNELSDFLKAVEITQESRHPAKPWVALITELEIWLQGLANSKNFDHLIPVDEFIENGTFIGPGISF